MSAKDAAYYNAIVSPTVEYPDDRTEIEQSDGAIGARNRAIDEGRLIPVPEDEFEGKPDDPAGGDNPSPCEGCGATATYNDKEMTELTEGGILIVDTAAAASGSSAGIGPANWVWTSPANAPAVVKLTLKLREVLVTPVSGTCVATNDGGCIEKDPCTFSVFIRFTASLPGLIPSWLPALETPDPTNANFIAHLRVEESGYGGGRYDVSAYSYAIYVLEFKKTVSCGDDPWEFNLGSIVISAGLGWIGANQPEGGSTASTSGQLGTTDTIQMECAACS